MFDSVEQLMDVHLFALHFRLPRSVSLFSSIALLSPHGPPSTLETRSGTEVESKRRTAFIRLLVLWQDGEFWDADVTSSKLHGYFISEEGEYCVPAELAEVLSHPIATAALGGLVSYLRKLNLDAELVNAGRFGPLAGSSSAASRHMTLDAQALSDLNILDCGTSRAPGGTAVSLFQHMDHCKTGFGRRCVEHVYMFGFHSEFPYSVSLFRVQAAQMVGVSSPARY